MEWDWAMGLGYGSTGPPAPVMCSTARCQVQSYTRDFMHTEDSIAIPWQNDDVHGIIDKLEGLYIYILCIQSHINLALNGVKLV